MASETDSGRQAQQKAERAADQAQQKAGELAEQAKDQARSQASMQKERAAEGLDSVAKALHQTGDTLRDEDNDTLARYLDDAANRVENFSGYLRNRSPEELFHEAERFARRDSALFLGGAFTLGVLAARFLKSSSPGRSRYGSSYERYGHERRVGGRYRTGETRHGAATGGSSRTYAGRHEGETGPLAAGGSASSQARSYSEDDE